MRKLNRVDSEKLLREICSNLWDVKGGRDVKGGKEFDRFLDELAP